MLPANPEIEQHEIPRQPDNRCEQPECRDVKYQEWRGFVGNRQECRRESLMPPNPHPCVKSRTRNHEMDDYLDRIPVEKVAWKMDENISRIEQSRFALGEVWKPGVEIRIPERQMPGCERLAIEESERHIQPRRIDSGEDIEPEKFRQEINNRHGKNRDEPPVDFEARFRNGRGFIRHCRLPDCRLFL